MMLVRPEALRLTLTEPGALPATITARRFVGPAAIFTARTDGGAVLDVVAPPRSVPAGARVGLMPSRRAGGGIHLFPPAGPMRAGGAGAARGRAAARSAWCGSWCTRWCSCCWKVSASRRAGLSEYVRLFFARPTEWEALWGSLWISLASVALAGLIGVPLAFLFARYDLPGRRLLGGLVALPAVLPPLVGVLAFLFLYGETGFVSLLVQRVLGLTDPPWRLQGAGAILLVHAYSMYVYFYLFVRAALADARRLAATRRRPAWARGGGARCAAWSCPSSIRRSAARRCSRS